MPRTFDEITEMPERWAQALALRAQGLTYQAIGNVLGVTGLRARQIVRAAQRRARIIEAAAATAKACLLGLGFALLAGTAKADPCKAIPDHGPLPAYLASGSQFSGPVTYVGDGDSLCVALGPSPSQWVEVRLADFYAPELHEPGGEAAKAALRRLTLHQWVSCFAGRRSYDRVVSRCTLNGRDLGDAMRSSGTREGGRGR